MFARSVDAVRIFFLDLFESSIPGIPKDTFLFCGSCYHQYYFYDHSVIYVDLRNFQ